MTRRTPRQCKQKTIGLPLSPQADGECQLNSMSDDIEIQFRGGYPKKWHSESTPQVRPKK